MLVGPILVALLLGQPPTGGPASASATLSVNVGGHARLSLAPTAMVFPDADPDQVPSIASVPSAITITAKARAPRGAQVTLTVQAADDLRSGVATLPASLITWGASGAGFVPGVLSRSSAQLVGTWTGSGVRSGSQSFAFENRWTHAPGTYSVTFVYTISTP
jgi:hypothetical protein